jgi:hypothetical protein
VRKGPEDDPIVAAVIAVVVTAGIAGALPAILVPATRFPAIVRAMGIRDHHPAGVAPVVMGRQGDGHEGHQGKQDQASHGASILGRDELGPMSVLLISRAKLEGSSVTTN